MSPLDALLDALAPPFGADEIRVVILPIATGCAEALLELEPAEPAFYWANDEGQRFAGVGAAAVVRASGATRMDAVAGGADGLWSRIRTRSVAWDGPVHTRLWGGFSFLPEPPPPPWDAFGEASFILPRVGFMEDADGHRLAVAASAGDSAGDVVGLAARSLEALQRGTPCATATQMPPPLTHATKGEDVDWARAVSSVQGRIDGGNLKKAVVARSREIRFRTPPEPAAVLGRLASATEGTRFAFRYGGRTFLGATPERLVARRGLEVRSEALAGTLGVSGADCSPEAAELLASAKDGAEHAYVVRAIAEALGPLCAELEHPPAPTVRTLRHMLHLQTPFQGRLREPVPVLDLVSRLHPTPAVGGTPTREALDWIAAEEGVSRGWYAAPVGWFDADGDGEFMVALRSALLDGDRALLFAGAGIVRDSDPAAELAETDVKLRTMLTALGVDP